MIGRGDLGVEVPFTELPALQKYIITKCRLLGKRVITATEMLESMITNPPPDESGNFRRCERCLRRHECGHALRRISRG